ncbi:4-demethylwyosine synthase TYW1 [Candidatus Woesearchaeota archaeon]|nr:4-demethylwyosine synthase TYW1 [Candidatus Woesearchaeota archaeon]
METMIVEEKPNVLIKFDTRPSKIVKLNTENQIDVRRKALEKQGYRLVGNHSAVKVCFWTKNSLRDDGLCYKNKFYGIESSRCIQMSSVLDFCNLRCEWCWRDIAYSDLRFKGKADSPKDIVEGCMDAHKKYLQGFKGSSKVTEEKFYNAMKPMHFAISLTGEVTLYPRLDDLVEEINDRGMTTFVVTNGTNPSMIKKLIKKQPTQLYITLPAPDEETYIKSCKPLTNDSWQKIMESLKLLRHFNRSVIRLTLTKNLNFLNPEGYGNLVKDVDFDFLEVKAAMPIGYASRRLDHNQMCLHKEIKDFSEKLAKTAGLKILDEEERSRVVLLGRKDREDRIMKF